MHDCSAEGCTKLLTLFTDNQGSSNLVRLPACAKWWQVIGGTVAGAYGVYGNWGPYTWQIESVNNATMHSAAFVGGPEFFLKITGSPNAVYFVTVSM